MLLKFLSSYLSIFFKSSFIPDDKKYKPIILGNDIAKIMESEKFMTLPRFIELPIIVKDKKINLKEYLLNALNPNI